MQTQNVPFGNSLPKKSRMKALTSAILGGLVTFGWTPPVSAADAATCAYWQVLWAQNWTTLQYTPFLQNYYAQCVYQPAASAAAVPVEIPPINLEVVPPSTTPLCSGSSFDVTIKAVQKGALPIDSAENIALKFNPMQLRVNRITNSGVLDDLLDASYDNANGTLNFTAGRWNSPAPTGSFDLFTINVTAIGIVGQPIALDLQKTGTLTYGGSKVLFTTTDGSLTLSQCLRYDAKFQREQPRPHVSWQTPLDIYLTTSAGTKLYQSTSDNKGSGVLTLTKPLSSSDYLCVKNSHTLANRISSPFDNPIDFGTVLEGDAKNDNTVDMLDYSFLTSHQGCRGGANSKYDPQADFNVSNCVNTKDRDLLKANLNKPSACKFNSTLKVYRHGQRSLDATLPPVAFGGTAWPSDLTVGTSFDYTIQVHATDAQAADGASVYLNFDPTQLQVNSVTPGTVFDSTLENSFDNTTGEINFAAGVWDNPAPTQAMDLVTINFTVLQADSEPSLSFSTAEGRQTMIAAGGEEVTALSDEGDILIKPAETVVPPPPPTTETGTSAFGKVVDALNLPVAGATIQLEGQTVTTDAEGNWTLTGLPAGKPAYVATLTGEGYQSQVLQCQQNKEGKYGCYSQPLHSSLQLKVGVSPSPIVGLGENLTYTLTVTNAGTQTATGVGLQDVLPAGTQLVSLQPLNGGSCDTNTVSCTLPDLTAGASTKVKLVVKPTAVSKLENTVKATANNYPAEIAKAWTEVKPLLSVTTKDTPDPVNMLDKLHYRYQVELSKSASAPATGVNLVSQLPSGVELQTAKTEFGECDTSSLPTVRCPLPDMAVGSSTAVNLEVLLKDAGMLLLTNDATVSAANYPAHTFKERTHIFVPDNIKIDMVFVIDTTNSMQEEIDGVVAAIKKFIAEVDPSQRPTAALVTFKDDVKVEAFTQDLNVLLGAAEKLQATGGGTCPEASAEALGIAIKHLQDGGVLMLATDASPYDSADVTGLAEQIRAKNMKFHALVTGDCTDQQSWNEVK